MDLAGDDPRVILLFLPGWKSPGHENTASGCPRFRIHEFHCRGGPAGRGGEPQRARIPSKALHNLCIPQASIPLRSLPVVEFWLRSFKIPLRVQANGSSLSPPFFFLSARLALALVCLAAAYFTNRGIRSRASIRSSFVFSSLFFIFFFVFPPVRFPIDFRATNFREPGPDRRELGSRRIAIRVVPVERANKKIYSRIKDRGGRGKGRKKSVHRPTNIVALIQLSVGLYSSHCVGRARRNFRQCHSDSLYNAREV